MQALQDLLHLPQAEQQALGIVATAGEIAQQPATWLTTRQIFKQHAEALQRFLEDLSIRGEAAHRPTVVLSGAGTSDYIGQALVSLLQSAWQCEVRAVASTDLLLDLDNILLTEQRYLVVSFSRSGQSPEGVAVLETLLRKRPEIAHLVVSCNAEGRMVSLAANRANAYAVVLDDAVNDRSLAMTSSFTNMVVFGQCLAHLWSSADYDHIFPALVEAGKAFLPIADEAARDLAERSPARVCLLGSGALTAVARESALKILEMTAGKIKTMSESVLGLRHGPMAALDNNTILLCFASSDTRRQRYERDLLDEVGAKGIVQQRVVVGREGDASLQRAADHYVPLQPGVPDLYRPPVDVILGQLFGFHASLAHKLHPDAPSPTGVISRVVGEFRIYEDYLL